MWPGGFETIVATKSGQRYEVLYLPDLHNDDLQAEGKAPVYYWLPNGVRIARAGDTGDFKFHLIHFEGVMSPDTTTGVTAPSEVAGGVLAFTVTCAPPLDVLEASHQQIKDRLRGDGRRYWGWRTPSEPQFAPVPISDSRTHMSNLSPRLDGTVPSSQPASGGPGGPTPTGGGAPGGPGAPGAPKSTVATRSLAPRLVRNNVPVRANRDVTPTGLDAWYMRIEGEGPGSLNPAGENAYVALCGSLPTAILWAGFHGTYSPVVVSQTLNLKVWSETLRIHIHGDWDRVFTHFSAAAQGRAWWFSADIKTEFNNLRINGGIKVEVEIDGTNPGADKMKEEVDKRIDLIVNKFTEEAKARIFDPAPPDVKPAEASSGGLLSSIFGGFGGGFALKYRRDETKLTLDYDETRQERFNLSSTISSSLEGFYNQIKADPEAERKYFTTLYLEDWDRKITHNIKPVVNWPDPGRKWVGEPVAFLACQIGYPAASGDIQWTPHVFQSTDTDTMTTWQPAFAKKAAGDVSNPPAGWTPDVSYIKRSIHFTEPPSETDNPLVRCFVEKNVVELDPGPNGSATNDQNIEVRADSAGKLDVGPIGLGALLEGPSQIVEVEFQAHGKTDEGNDRPVTRFMFSAQDQDAERYWTIFTGQPAFVPSYQYRVHVVVKGSLFSHGMEWWGDWVQTAGNGPIMLTVPTSDEAAQVRKLAPSSRPGSVTPAPSAPAASPAGPPGASATPAGKPQGSKSTTPAGKPPQQRTAPPSPAEVQGYTVGGGGADGVAGAAEQPATKDAPAEPDVPASEPQDLVLSDGWSATPPSSG